MYVVRRPFRNYGKVLEPGSVVEPVSIKRFKSRLNDRVIIEVSEQNFKKWNEYFKSRFGVEIKAEPVNTEPVNTEPVNTEPVNTEPVNTEPVVAQAKAVVTVTSK